MSSDNDFALPSFSQSLRMLRKTEHHVFHRLHSIAIDCQFLQRLIEAFQSFPIIANLRCGAWYAPRFDDTCYFKSTDGHYGKWDFSLPRLNYHIAVLAATKGGLLIVDSTRKGKEFPDSFTRTLPIWATVLNRTICKLKSSENADGALGIWKELHLYPELSRSEASRIEAKLESFVQRLTGSGIDLLVLNRVLDKPFRCFWISPQTYDNQQTPSIIQRASTLWTPLLLVNCSSTNPTTRHGWTYIQGAGDDHQTWALGLTPRLFWDHADQLLDPLIDADECERRAIDIVANFGIKCRNGKINPDDTKTEKLTVSVKPIAIGATGLSVISLQQMLKSQVESGFGEMVHTLCGDGGEMVILDISTSGTFPGICGNAHSIPIDFVNDRQHALERVLERVLVQIHGLLSAKTRVCVACDTGINTSVAVCTAALACLFSPPPECAFVSPTEINRVSLMELGVTKERIRRAQMYVTSFVESANVDRALMKQVNRFFMSPLKYSALNENKNED